MLTNFNLEDIMKHLKIKDFQGVFSKDELPVRKKSGFYIINLENSVDEKGKPLGGTHWVFFYLDMNTKEKFYFDSFGVVPPLEIEQFLGYPIVYNGIQIQDFNSVNCGWFVVYLIYQMSKKNRKFNEIIKKDFIGDVLARGSNTHTVSGDTSYNDVLLMEYIKDILQ